MGKKEKQICDWKKSDYTAESLSKIAGQPRFFCEKCGRVANKKKFLCEPKKLGND